MKKSFFRKLSCLLAGFLMILSLIQITPVFADDSNLSLVVDGPGSIILLNQEDSREIIDSEDLTVEPGTEVGIRFVPQEGAKLSDVTVNGESQDLASMEEEGLDLTMGEDRVEISAWFSYLPEEDLEPAEEWGPEEDNKQPASKTDMTIEEDLEPVEEQIPEEDNKQPDFEALEPAEEWGPEEDNKQPASKTDMTIEEDLEPVEEQIPEEDNKQPDFEADLTMEEDPEPVEEQVPEEDNKQPDFEADLTAEELKNAELTEAEEITEEEFDSLHEERTVAMLPEEDNKQPDFEADLTAEELKNAELTEAEEITEEEFDSLHEERTVAMLAEQDIEKLPTEADGTIH